MVGSLPILAFCTIASSTARERNRSSVPETYRLDTVSHFLIHSKFLEWIKAFIIYTKFNEI
ncbi:MULTISPECIES: hypothetical protein [Aerosakkonema]|uniref:hypothetical protein n=1 Tax=Aerosakkonema TaxID=1246629 RepID=UPI0035BA7EA6